MSNFWITITAFAGYLLGALPFGFLVAKAHGVDIFKVGSGNPGATNVKRVLGAKAGNTVFALDAVKGAVAAGWPLAVCYFVRPAGMNCGNDILGGYMLGLIGLIAAILGHSFSLFTRFKGGKGVATAAGGLVVLVPGACLTGAVVWVATFYGSRYVSLASILAAVAVAGATWFFNEWVLLNVVVTVLATFVVIRHHENIRRLLNGTESRFVKKSAAAAGAATTATGADVKKSTPQS